MTTYDDWKLASPREDDEDDYVDTWAEGDCTYGGPEECLQGGHCSNCPYYKGDQ